MINLRNRYNAWRIRRISKKLSKGVPYETEEEVAADITRQRRSYKNNPINLDDAIRMFREYCQDEGSFDELDFKEWLIEEWVKP